MRREGLLWLPQLFQREHNERVIQAELFPANRLFFTLQIELARQFETDRLANASAASISGFEKILIGVP